MHNYKEQNREYFVRVDRFGPLGNPYIMKTESDRDYACDKYEAWFEAMLVGRRETDEMARRLLASMVKMLEAGYSVALGCWCVNFPSNDPVPFKRCHAYTIAKYLDPDFPKYYKEQR